MYNHLKDSSHLFWCCHFGHQQYCLWYNGYSRIISKAMGKFESDLGFEPFQAELHGHRQPCPQTTVVCILSADTLQTRTTLIQKIAYMSQTQTDCRQPCLFNSDSKKEIWKWDFALNSFKSLKNIELIILNRPRFVSFWLVYTLAGSDRVWIRVDSSKVEWVEILGISNEFKFIPIHIKLPLAELMRF